MKTTIETLNTGDLIIIDRLFDFATDNYETVAPIRALVLNSGVVKNTDYTVNADGLVNDDATTNHRMIFITEDGTTGEFFDTYGFEVTVLKQGVSDYEFTSRAQARRDFSEGEFSPYFA